MIKLKNNSNQEPAVSSVKTVRFINDINTKINVSRFILIMCITGWVAVILGGLYLYNSAIAKQKENAFILDSNYNLASAKSLQFGDNEKLEREAFIKHSLTTFYDLDPDEEQIKATLSKARYYGDFEALEKSLHQGGYFNNLVTRGIFQRGKINSIEFDKEFKTALVKGVLNLKFYFEGKYQSSYKYFDCQFEIERKDRTKNNEYGFYMHGIKVRVSEKEKEGVSEGGKAAAQENSLMPQENGFVKE